MSDHFYAVEFRSMHTAIHNIAVFSLEEKAQELYNIIKTTEQLPDEFEFEFEPMNFIGIFEINFRDPLREVEGMEVLYINNPENSIPNVYNY